jgi:hypothetical protein
MRVTLLVRPTQLQASEEVNMDDTMKNTVNSTAIENPSKISVEQAERMRRREVVRAFLNRYKIGKELLARLKTHYEDITSRLDAPDKYKGWKLINTDPALATSEKFDLVNEKEALEKKMKELESVVEAAEAVLTLLSERQRLITEAYLFATSPYGVADKLSRRFWISESRIHHLHTEALEKIYSMLDRLHYFEKDAISKGGDVSDKACDATDKDCDATGKGSNASNIHIADKANDAASDSNKNTRKGGR